MNIKSNLLDIDITSFGAELTSIKDIKSGTQILWQGDEKIWNGRSPILFPIIGRIIDDKLKYYGKTYILEKHGFARKSEFAERKLSENTAEFELLSNDATRRRYPFEFKLIVKYTVENSKITTEYRVENLNDGDMYFSIGGHPGFNMKIGDKLFFEKKETLDRLFMNDDAYIEKRIPCLNDSDCIEVTEDIFKEDALIFENLKSQYVTLETEKYDVKLTYFNATHLGIWAKPAAPYVCIEPWFGYNDDVDADCDYNEKKGILKLAKGETFTYNFDIEIDMKR